MKETYLTYNNTLIDALHNQELEKSKGFFNNPGLDLPILLPRK